MEYITLALSIIAIGVSVFSVWYRWKDDRRKHWWDRVTWALDRALSADVPAERELYWDILTHHLSNPPSKWNQDDKVTLQAMRRYLVTVVSAA